MEKKIISCVLPKNYKIPKKDIFIVENTINEKVICGNSKIEIIESKENINDTKLITKFNLVSFSPYFKI